MNFGETVRSYRQRLGMTQRALADRSDLHPSHLNRVEKGKDSPPGVEKVLRLVEALRLQPTEAIELVKLAGYSPEVLQTGLGLAYSSPSLPDDFRLSSAQMEAAFGKLRAMLSRLDPEQQQRCIGAFLTLLDAVLIAPSATPSVVSQEQGGK